jgi:hypothetical protein
MQEQEQEQPQSKVLTTPELLETILLHLDTRTLLVSAQRVCQTWKVLIQTSPTIQQALFFRPTASNPNSKKANLHGHAKSICNSLLSSPLKKDTISEQGSMNGDKFPCSQPIYNPLLVQAFPPFFPLVYEGDLTEEEKRQKSLFSFKRLDMLSSQEKKTAYMRKEASWRKMLLCQPPVYRDVTIFKMHHAMGGDRYKSYQVCPSNPSPFPTSSLKERQVPQKALGFDDTLKMGHLFRTLIQNSDIYFGRFGQTRVYWSAYVPPCNPGDDYPPEDGSFYPAVQKGFGKAIKKSEVVIFSREVIQCHDGEERELTDEESLREEIIEAETEGSKGGKE